MKENISPNDIGLANKLKETWYILYWMLCENTKSGTINIKI